MRELGILVPRGEAEAEMDRLQTGLKAAVDVLKGKGHEMGDIAAAMLLMSLDICDAHDQRDWWKGLVDAALDARGAR